MSKLLTAGLCALFITGSSLASAQTPFAGDRAAAAADARSAAAERVKQLLSVDWKALTDLRVGIVKAALQLKPDQEKYWPALEQAIRDRAAVRHQRLENLAALLGQQGESNPIAALRERAASLSQRGEALNKLADAWQPLYETLDANQKQRLRLAAAYVLHEVREALESRRIQDEDEDED